MSKKITDTKETKSTKEAKEVIILGMGPTHHQCKFHCETWGVNGTYSIAPKLDKLFFADEAGEVANTWYDMPQIKKVVKQLVFPIPFPKFQNLGVPVEIYPIDKIIVRFGTRFFSNTIAYMLAYGLYHGYNKFWFYGIDMLTNSSYIQEKGGVEFWMGIALGMGCQIVNTRDSATGKTWNGKMYGYWGTLDKEKANERLYAPWEIVKVIENQPDEEWVKADNNNWIRIPYSGGVMG